MTNSNEARVGSTDFSKDFFKSGKLDFNEDTEIVDLLKPKKVEVEEEPEVKHNAYVKPEEEKEDLTLEDLFEDKPVREKETVKESGVSLNSPNKEIQIDKTSLYSTAGEIEKLESNIPVPPVEEINIFKNDLEIIESTDDFPQINVESPSEPEHIVNSAAKVEHEATAVAKPKVVFSKVEDPASIIAKLEESLSNIDVRGDIEVQDTVAVQFKMQRSNLVKHTKNLEETGSIICPMETKPSYVPRGYTYVKDSNVLIQYNMIPKETEVSRRGYVDRKKREIIDTITRAVSDDSKVVTAEYDKIEVRIPLKESGVVAFNTLEIRELLDVILSQTGLDTEVTFRNGEFIVII